jgi:hypothetical protein
VWILSLGFPTSARLRIGAGTTGAPEVQPLGSASLLSLLPPLPACSVPVLALAKPVAGLRGMHRVLPSYGRVALSLVRFFSADAANLPLISLTAPAQEGDPCQSTTARGGWRVRITPPTDGASAAAFVASLGPVPEARPRGEDDT